MPDPSVRASWSGSRDARSYDESLSRIISERGPRAQGTSVPGRRCLGRGAGRCVLLNSEIFVKEMAMNLTRLVARLAVLAQAAGTFAAVGKSDPQLDREAATNLRHLVNSNATTWVLNSQALAVLIVPEGNKITVVTARSGGLGLSPLAGSIHQPTGETRSNDIWFETRRPTVAAHCTRPPLSLRLPGQIRPTPGAISAASAAKLGVDVAGCRR
jgi:hypothetical protein